MTYFFKTVGSFISKLVGQVKGETWLAGKCENSFRVFSGIKWKQCQYDVIAKKVAAVRGFPDG